MNRFLAIAIALLVPQAAHAIEAYRLAPGERIVLDGNLDDAAWARAKPWDRFYEVAPDDKIESK
ncbi:MAG: hypothetical protein ACXWBL_15880, partial [Usitatibacter sp.]